MNSILSCLDSSYLQMRIWFFWDPFGDFFYVMNVWVFFFDIPPTRNIHFTWILIVENLQFVDETSKILLVEWMKSYWWNEWNLVYLLIKIEGFMKLWEKILFDRKREKLIFIFIWFNIHLNTVLYWPTSNQMMKNGDFLSHVFCQWKTKIAFQSHKRISIWNLNTTKTFLYLILLISNEIYCRA